MTNNGTGHNELVNIMENSNNKLTTPPDSPSVPLEGSLLRAFASKIRSTAKHGKPVWLSILRANCPAGCDRNVEFLLVLISPSQGTQLA